MIKAKLMSSERSLAMDSTGYRRQSQGLGHMRFGKKKTSLVEYEHFVDGQIRVMKARYLCYNCGQQKSHTMMELLGIQCIFMMDCAG